MMYPLAVKCDSGLASDAEREALMHLEIAYDRIAPATTEMSDPYP